MNTILQMFIGPAIWMLKSKARRKWERLFPALRLSRKDKTNALIEALILRNKKNAQWHEKTMIFFLDSSNSDEMTIHQHWVH